MSRSARQFFAISFVFVGFGLVLLPWLFWTEWRVRHMTSWPETEATVLSAGIHSHKPRYQPLCYLHDIAYAYTVGGTKFRNERVAYGGIGPNWSYRNGALDALPPVGSTIHVKYNPADPQDSVIHVVTSGVFDPPILRWLLVVLVIAAGIATVFSGQAVDKRKKMKTTEPNQALQHNDPSCHVSCLRTPRASRGRG
jgi:hypothetical protein